MPTVLGGKGKLSIVCFLLRCAYSQVTRSQHNSCAKDILEDMTQSWPSQQALGGDQAQRILYSPKDAKQATAQQRQGRGDVQLRMTRRPHMAPHKSMLVDDLKLSSDDEDTYRAAHESTSWDKHSQSAQQGHTHGRRVRHSSSDSSGSDSTVESASSSLHSRSQSPEVHPDPASPANRHPPCNNNKETDRPSAAQWQLDKWLKKSRKKSASSEQQQVSSQNTAGRLPSPHTQHVPSPLRSWDSNQEYSPSQSPIPSPQFNYSHDNTPLPSPGYSYCPSPSPFTSTCASPSPSPRHSSILSPALSVCPSPCGSPRGSRSPSPATRGPPKSPSPSLPSPTRLRHYPESQPDQTTNSHRTKIRSWTGPLPNSDNRNKLTNKGYPHPTHQHRPRARPTQDQDQNQSKSKASAVLNSDRNHSHKSRPKSNCHPNLKQLSDAPKAKHSLHFEQIQSSRSNHSSNHKLRPQFQPSSQLSPTRAKHLVPASREANTSHSSQSKAFTNSITGSGSNSRASLSLKPRAKLWEATATTAVHVNHTKASQRKPHIKDQEVDHRREHPSQAEARRRERKEDGHREKQKKTQDRKEERRLAEEQLLRRPWIQSSAEEEEEEEEVIERHRRREEESKGENRRREQQHRREWQTVEAKQRLPTDAKQHRIKDNSHLQGATKKGGRSEEESEPQPAPSPPPSRSPTPQRPPSPSSSSSFSSPSSNSDSEYQAPITKVPADSTSHKRLRKGGQQGPNRPDTSRPKAGLIRGPISTKSSEGQQGDGKQKLYTLVPFGRGDQATVSSHRGLRNLVVQIDLCLLKRVPDSTTSSPVKKPPSSPSSSLLTKDKQREAMKHLYIPDSKRKRKLENGVSHRDSKRTHPQTNDLPGHTETSTHTAAHDFLTETTHNGYLEEYLDSKRPLSPLSPLSNSPESAKPPPKTKALEQHHIHTHKNRDKNRDSSVKTQPKTEVECIKVSRQPQPPPESWGPAGHIGTAPNHETPHHAEYYLHEAKRMKHRADAMVDKLGKAVNYVDAALSFMECGKAMEEGPLEAKSPYTMYSETVELIRYAMRLKSHSGPGARQEDKQLAVLCFRCLALLYWQMFRLKKDHALKYSKVLLDYFKSSPKVPTTPPCWNDHGKNVGGPLPSLSPNAKNLGRSSHGGSTSPSFISIPQRIHQMAANHLNITNSVLFSYEYWEVADNLAKENKEFFNYLNTLSGPLTLHSSIAHTVQYTRQALQWIRISAKLN
ncbi:hypothetical protein JOB18_016212 [Solea senegalensis]|uniref:AF4/FMR2 C-terminal homology domain-containing protein n=2 Tax=Solea senegalensis TaxID=28829 RepID=A0AAV6RCM5_SOLSE|nr:AF4/FMR2 family member 3 isoform X1 [Solea senegalensis]KAG7502230.1 hypothetical protein JOB18_016212 [Solea senegalensis]